MSYICNQPRCVSPVASYTFLHTKYNTPHALSPAKITPCCLSRFTTSLQSCSSIKLEYSLYSLKLRHLFLPFATASILEWIPSSRCPHPSAILTVGLDLPAQVTDCSPDYQSEDSGSSACVLIPNVTIRRPYVGFRAVPHSRGL